MPTPDCAVVQIGLNLFAYPLNIINMLSWLVMPTSPTPVRCCVSVGAGDRRRAVCILTNGTGADRLYQKPTVTKNEDRAKREKECPGTRHPLSVRPDSAPSAVRRSAPLSRHAELVHASISEPWDYGIGIRNSLANFCRCTAAYRHQWGCTRRVPVEELKSG